MTAGREHTEWAPPRSLYPHVLAVLTTLVIEPAFRAPYLSISQWLRDFYARPAPGRDAWRRQRFHEVLDHAATHVPFYRTLLAGTDTGSTELHRLPVVDKARIRADMASFRSEGWEDMPHVVKKTGGTTGDPWRYPLDRRAWAHMYGAALHFRERAGYRYGERLVVLGSPSSIMPGGSGLQARARARLERRVVSAAGLRVDHSSSLERARRASDLQGVLWYGYAGTIEAMADAVARAGIEVLAPHAIVTTAETLQPSWRRRIEDTFGVPLYDEYGCNDGGVLAQSCARGRYHVAENISMVEVLDGDEPCPPGVEGDVVVTNLHARVLPFLRYRTGDRAVAGEGPCPCGTAGTTLESIAGRQGDRLRLPDGTELSPISFGHCFKEATPNVRRWQVVHDQPAHVTVRLDVHPHFGEDEVRAVESYFADLLGTDVGLTVTTTDPIEVTRAGKHKVVVKAFDG